MQYFWMDGVKMFDGPYHDVEEAINYAKGMKSFASPEHMHIFLATFDPESKILDLYRDESDNVITWRHLAFQAPNPTVLAKHVTKELWKAAAVTAPQVTTVHTSHFTLLHKLWM